jgi:hypothetical protein
MNDPQSVTPVTADATALAASGRNSAAAVSLPRQSPRVTIAGSAAGDLPC